MARPKLCTKYKVYSFTAFENIAEGMSNVLCHAPRHWSSGHVTSSVTWLLDWPWAICYRCSTDTDTLSPKDFEVLRLIMYLRHDRDLSRSRDVISHVIILSRDVLSSRCSIDTNLLSWTVCEITWRHRSRDRSLAHGALPMGVPLILTLYLQGILKYWGSNVSGSRLWPF